jgi:hypothetical protein
VTVSAGKEAEEDGCEATGAAVALEWSGNAAGGMTELMADRLMDVSSKSVIGTSSQLSME